MNLNERSKIMPILLPVLPMPYGVHIVPGT
jgi:hypothetical protein